jgi:hypothetical protein
VADDHLTCAVVHVRIGNRLDLVAECDQALAQLGRRRRLEVDRDAAVQLPARRVERRLRVHSVGEKARQRLHVPGG